MKLVYSFLIIILILTPARADNFISVAQFQRITDPVERQKAIDQASPEQRDQLKQIDRHLRLLAGLGGEVGLKTVKERSVERSRGLLILENVFRTQTQIWDNYASGLYEEMQKSPAKKDHLLEEQNDTEKERMIINNRYFNLVHPLVFRLALSPQALDLEKTAEKLNDDMYKRLVVNGSTAKQAVTKQELSAFDTRVDEIYAQLEALPKLTPEQAQKEYDDFPEQDVGKSDL
jgi:hypothetical protein